MSKLSLSRRQALEYAVGWAGLAMLPRASQAQGAGRVGILMLHGKNPGSAQSPTYARPKRSYEKEGWLVTLPDMPWSATRYLDGGMDQAMAEIAGHVQQLRNQGATRIVLVAHSIGVPMTMAYAARGGDVTAMVHFAPGHIPKGFYQNNQRTEVRESVDRARALVAEGQGDTRHQFADINQGKLLSISTTAAHYLSYFDPTSDAEMSVTAPKLPPQLPVLTAIGRDDVLYPRIRGYYLDLLPDNPHHQFVEVAGGHLDTLQNAHDAAVQWIKTLDLAPQKT